MLHLLPSHHLDSRWLCSDIFVGRQHETKDLPLSWWSDEFQRAVAEIGHTVLVLKPWNKPVPLNRSWCLVRCICAHTTSAAALTSPSRRARSGKSSAL